MTIRINARTVIVFYLSCLRLAAQWVVTERYISIASTYTISQIPVTSFRHWTSCMPYIFFSITSTHSLSYLFRLTLVLTHKLANGITLSANIMSIVLLYKYSGGQQGPSPRFPSEQCFVCRDEGYESIRCSTPTTGRNCLHTCTLP